jgi:hypothetical protein
MLVQDISQDYKGIDFLQPITFYKRLTETTWDTGHAIANCWLQDLTKALPATVMGGTDLKRRIAGVTIWENEWYDDTVSPARGDKFSVSEPQFAGASNSDTVETYIIERVVVIDLFRSQAMRLEGYRTTN